MRRTTRPSEATRSGGLTAPSRSTGWRSSESRSFSRSPPRISAPRRRTSRTRSWCSSARSRYPDAAEPPSLFFFPFSRGQRQPLAAKVEFRNVGVLEELLCGPLIAVPARLQNVSAVRYGECLLRVLLHHHDRGPASIDLHDLGEHHIHEFRGEARRGLIDQEDVGVQHHRLREGDHLLLPAAEVPRPLPQLGTEVRKEGDRLDGPSPNLRVVHHARRRRRTPATIPGHRDGGGPPGDGAHLQVLEDREGRERVVRLRDVGKPVEDQVPRRFSRDVEALEGHLAGGRSEEAEYRLDEGRFAGPIGPNDRHDFLAVESHRHTMEDFHFPIARMEVLGFEEDHHPPRYDSITTGFAFTLAGVPSAIVRPWCMTITRSHRFMTTFMSCSIKKNVRPSRRSFSMRSMRLPARVGFTPATGSSRRTKVGSVINARASSNSFFWPPESAFACSLAKASSWVSRRTSRARCLHRFSSRRTKPGWKNRLVRCSPALCLDPRTRFSRTVILRSS